MTIRGPERGEAPTRPERAPPLSGVVQYRAVLQIMRAAAPVCLYRPHDRHPVEWIGSATPPSDPASVLHGGHSR